MALSRSSLLMVKDQVLPLVQKELAAIQIPPIEQKHISCILGHVDFRIEGTHVQQLKFGKSDIVIGKDEITVSIDVPTFHMHIDKWSFNGHCPIHMHGSGNADAHGDGVHVSLSISVGRDGAGRPVVKCRGCQVHLNGIHLQVHGSKWDFFIRLFKGIVETQIKKAVNNAGGQICSAITEVSHELLSQLPTQVTLPGDRFALRFPLADPPTQFTPEFVTLGIKGEIVDIKSPLEYPVPPQPHAYNITGEMLQIAVNQYLPDSGLHALFHSGLLDVYVTDKDLPAWSPLRLNTSSWAWLIPSLQKRWPDRPMRAHLFPTHMPKCEFIPQQGMAIHGDYAFEMDVLLANGSAVNVFELDVALSTSMVVRVALNGTQLQVTGAISEATRLELSIVETLIGRFDLKPVEKILNILLDEIVIPMLNVPLKQGILIPLVQGLTLKQPLLLFEPRFCVVSSDFSFTL
eukprot:gnl/Trimastix_PCT/2662.p1 GENE.gnl/Trimastix_PCT/2662~~gnl/Trimastix_PCT/2662.p1  ORF type:complete len:499 (+),score=133.02 gnl/Trimastix_PCT/2662:118-1497(+)